VEKEEISKKRKVIVMAARERKDWSFAGKASEGKGVRSGERTNTRKNLGFPSGGESFLMI